MLCVLIVLTVTATVAVESMASNGQKKLVHNGPYIAASDADINDHPWQVSLLHKSKHICGGAIVSKRVALTAAHCTDGVSLSELQMRVGSAQNTAGGFVCNVNSIIQHPDFDAHTLNSDLAIIFVEGEFYFGRTVAPIKLATAGSVEVYSVTASVTGWGALYYDGHVTEQLRWSPLSIYSAKDCRRFYAHCGPITKTMLCAGWLHMGLDVCTGDSGGPLVVKGKTLVGIASWGIGCGIPHSPGVFTSIAAMRVWIDSKLNRWVDNKVFKLKKMCKSFSLEPRDFDYL